MIFSFFSRKQSTRPEDEDDGDKLQAHTRDKPQSSCNDDRDTASAILPPPPSKSPSPSASFSPPPPPAKERGTDPSSLYALIRSVPPQTFHTYSLDRLGARQDPPTSPTVLTALSSFFSALVPPPRLHCVRCHKSYFEVENSDRSCLVPHDDESAEVERVALSIGKAKGLASEYQTHYGCCGRTVEGDGDMGPPDGWCYEGKHTTDIKRARFRADSTPNDDKLVPCSRLRCPGQLLSPSPSSARSHTGRAAGKRARPVEDETDAEDPLSQTDIEKDRLSPKRRRTKSTASRRKSGGSISATATTAATAGGTSAANGGDKEEKKPDAMDIDLTPSSSTKSKPKPMRIRKKPKSAAFIEDDGTDSCTSTPPSAAKTSSKPRPRKPKSSTSTSVAPFNLPQSSSPLVHQQDQQEPEATSSSLHLDPTKPSTSSPQLPQAVVNPSTPKTKKVSILESQLNNSVGSLSDLSSVKSSSPGLGTKTVQRVAYVEVTKSMKRSLRSEETMLLDDTDREIDKGEGEHDKETDKEDKDDKERKLQGEDGVLKRTGSSPKSLKSTMKTRSSPRRQFKLRTADLARAIKNTRSRTRTAKPLSEVVETSVDAEKIGRR